MQSDQQIVTTQLRGMVQWRGRMVFRTALASMYPPRLGVLYGKLIAESLELRLAAEAKRAPIPMALASRDQGVPIDGGSASASWDGEEADEPAADVLDPFVWRGLGAPKGLSEQEHVVWASGLRQPCVEEGVQLDDDLKDALRYEVGNEPEAIYEFRASVMEYWTSRAEALKGEQAEWAATADPRTSLLVSRLHGPLAAEIMKASGHKDADLPEAWRCGFPYVGQLPQCMEAVKQVVPGSLGNLTESQLRSERAERNQFVLSQLRESEWDGDLMAEADKDLELGAMTAVVPLSNVDLDSINVSRRLPVREQKSAGWRTRAVEHKTESGVNLATQPVDKMIHDGLDTLVAMTLVLIRAGC
eukprot:15820862-Heterocapsa_arctica.AAC.1